MKQLLRYSLLGVFLFTCSGIDSAQPVGEGELIPVFVLPSVLPEASGMIEYNNMLYIINDGGDGPWIYGLDPATGVVEKKINIYASNIDWEEITQDENNIYIGDFGNNSGTRKDLKILIIKKSDLNNDTVRPSGIINFSYSDQTTFSTANQNTPFDCEAFVVSQGKVILFSKDWTKNNTKVYTMPATPGTYSAQPVKTFETQGLVTGAAYSEGRLILTGYNPESYYSPFIFIADNFSFANATYGNRVRISFPGSTFVQVESVIITGTGEVRLASEANPLAFATLYKAVY